MQTSILQQSTFLKIAFDNDSVIVHMEIL